MTSMDQQYLYIDERFEDSRRSSLIQLADVVAGSIARSYQLDKTDSQEYIQLLNDRVEIIYRP